MNEIDWEKLAEELKTNIHFALDLVDDFYGTPRAILDEVTNTDSLRVHQETLKERMITFQEILRVLFPMSIKEAEKESKKT